MLEAHMGTVMKAMRALDAAAGVSAPEHLGDAGTERRGLLEPGARRDPASIGDRGRR